MQDIVDYERRITAALKRIEEGIGAVASANRAADTRAAELSSRVGIAETALAEAHEALAEAARTAEQAAAEAVALAEQAAAEAAEKAAKQAAEQETAAPDFSFEPGDGAALRDEPTLVKMRERLLEARGREAALRNDYEERLGALTRIADQQGLELARLRRVTETLREQLRVLHEAAAAGLSDPAQVNRAMLAELEALRATRLSEMAELEEITAALAAHLQEAGDAGY